MKFDIVITNQAEADLQDIYEYIDVQLLAPSGAKRILAVLIKYIESLREFPMRFKKFEQEPWNSKGLHVMPAHNFLVLYIPDETENKVHILRVVYGKRDLDAVLSDI